MKISAVTTDSAVRKQVRRNLREWFKRATDDELNQGLTWYAEAQEYAQELSNTFGVSGEIAAGVISALSPNNKWNRNKFDAMQVLQAVRDGRSPDDVKVCTYNANKAKAFEIAMGNTRILKQSPKTYAFARNVGALDPDHVTIDKWHLRACQTTSRKPVQASESVTPKQYRIIEDETAKVAREMGVTGYVFQAVVWVTIRNQWN